MRLLAFVIPCTLLLLAACGTEPQERDASDGGGVPSNLAEPASAALPTVEPALTRRDLILAALEASSDLVRGTQDAERQQKLDGRSFTFRIRLCEGAPSRDRLTFDRKERVLRVSVTPDLDSDDPVAEAVGAGKFEAVEGFWVPYPWLLRAACPPAPPPSGVRPQDTTTLDVPATERPTLALAEFFLPGADRSNRREGRPFSITRRLGEGVAAGPVDLVLEGRLTRLPGAKVINCIAPSAMLEPQCIVSVRFDAVRLEQAESGELLGQWSGA